eukprot:TRINITY_DN696_c0_g1_i1.p1 TRINITY_DN696_c0_g1~~TRINITY_DN696_c0_g1_i1.p1  ORF type:complete len:462 (-),score=194.73 TRINITY_DN696_c0_g1_i1:39-1394(-)
MSDHLPPPMPLTRQRSSIDAAIADHMDEATATIEFLRSVRHPVVNIQPIQLSGCVFVGHTATDMDSIGSAIGAAELFDGIAARASDINSETEFALETFGLACPPPFLEVGTNKPVCLVDHNQLSQMTAGIDKKWLRGIIDHHALQSGTVVTDFPIYVDIRPWGSACTIIAHMFLSQNKLMKPATAGILLSGILSDTLNLRSPTTTEADRLLVGVLARVAGVEDCNVLAQKMFKAKSKNLLALSAHGLVRGDSKVFAFKSDALDTKIAFGVVETVDLEAVIGRKEELLLELRAQRQEQNVNFAFLAIVDIVNLRSDLLVCGAGEAALAVAAFGGVVKDNVLDLGSRVSRKKDYIPPISDVLQAGWIPPAVEEEKEEFGKVYMECTEYGCMVKRAPSLRKGAKLISAATRFINATNMAILHRHSANCHHDNETVQPAPQTIGEGCDEAKNESQ